MGSVWGLLRKPGNQRLLAWLGGGVVVAASGIWAVVIYVWPAHEAPTAVCADQGIAIGGNVSGAKFNNKVSGGTSTAGPCVTSTKNNFSVLGVTFRRCRLGSDRAVASEQGGG